MRRFAIRFHSFQSEKDTSNGMKPKKVSEKPVTSKESNPGPSIAKTPESTTKWAHIPQVIIACGRFDPNRNIKKHFISVHSSTYKGPVWFTNSKKVKQCQAKYLPSKERYPKWDKIDHHWLSIDGNDEDSNEDSSLSSSDSNESDSDSEESGSDSTKSK